MNTIGIQIIHQLLTTSSHISAKLSLPPETVLRTGDAYFYSTWYIRFCNFLHLLLNPGFCHPLVSIYLVHILSILYSWLTSLQKMLDLLAQSTTFSSLYCCAWPRVWFLVPRFQLCCFLFFISILYTGLVRTLGDKKVFRGAYPSMKCFKEINFQIFSLYLYLLFPQLPCLRRLSGLTQLPLTK